MRKYADPQQLKFRTARKDGIPGTTKSISRYDKLIVRNANRNQKKRMRQKSKLEINKILKFK